MLKIAIFGLSGSGKSTTAGRLVSILKDRGARVEVLKLAEPLYRLQSQYYEIAERKIGYYEQDQRLLESIAENLREISPYALVGDFMRRLALSTADVVINDDVRNYDHDYLGMKREDFRFIRVTCSEQVRQARLASRGDISVVSNSKTTDDLHRFEENATICTDSGGIEAAEHQCMGILSSFGVNV